MKFNKMYSKGLITGIACTLVLGAATMSFAEVGNKTLNAFYSNIKIVIDGKSIDPKDANGNKVEPFVVNGTTYLPIRAVGEALGKNVDWDGTTQTVSLGLKPGQLNDMTEVIEPYKNYYTDIYRLNNSKKLEMGGVKYNSGYLLDYRTDYLMFNLNGQYSEITGTVGAVDWDSLKSNELSIYLDEKLYRTIEIDPNKLPEKISIPVSGVNQLKMAYVNDYGGYVDIGFGNPTIK